MDEEAGRVFERDVPEKVTVQNKKDFVASIKYNLGQGITDDNFNIFFRYLRDINRDRATLLEVSDMSVIMGIQSIVALNLDDRNCGQLYLLTTQLLDFSPKTSGGRKKRRSKTRKSRRKTRANKKRRTMRK